MIRLVQIKRGSVRRVCVVEEPHLRLLDACSSIYELVNLSLIGEIELSELVRRRTRREALDYDGIYAGRSDWQILPAIDHPEEPARCLLSGTGLTHLGSARNRQNMHQTIAQEMTDSMKMFSTGVEGGRPPAGSIGTSSEWFYKGTGCSLRAHREPLAIPVYAEDGGEEAEIAGIYVISPYGRPCRVGMALGNEFSDHQLEKKNYLYLASSKLRSCSLGPEMVINPEFASISITAKIERCGKTYWAKTLRTGETEMCHSLQNIEHHHFKYEAHRRPGDVHIHFFGTDCLSYSDGVRLRNDDVVEVAAEGFGRPLRNPILVAGTAASLVQVIPLR